jgi:predicted nucleotidyltransferase component of viral defense system
LLLRLLPFISDETCFALKGGTAINLFLRDFPRLSVDIDLVFLGGGDRDAALEAIRIALDRVSDRVMRLLAGARINKSYENKADALRLLVDSDGVTVKIELSPVLRGTVYPPQLRSVTPLVEKEFGYALANVLSFEDVFAGKICAALDRQHPRDLFDIKLLLEHEGISERLRKAFIVYLVSHSRPIHELLAPRWKPLDAVYGKEFLGMTNDTVSVEQLRVAGTQLLEVLLEGIAVEEKRFLCSIYENKPDWLALGLKNIEQLPAVQWRLRNIARMTEKKRYEALQLLGNVLF